MPLKKLKKEAIKRFGAQKAKETVLLGFALLIFLTGTFLVWISTFKIPDMASFEQRKVSQATKIYDRTETILLYDVFEGVKRTVVTPAEISNNIKKATIAIEDGDFYNHPGIKITSFLRAVVANLVSGSYSQGGSTITQQVVKNSILTQDKTITRKLKEWVLALKLEKVMDKESILAIYLNESPYGGTIYGIEEASQAFFGKKASEVGVAEAAYLASIPNAPTYYSPYGNNKERLENRKNLVLQKMLQNNFIDQETYSKALEEKVVWKEEENIGIKAPHFVIYIKQYLEKKYGERAVEENGFKVVTTLNYELQQKAEEIVKKRAALNKVNFNANNASLVAIDPKTGQIITMVGSADYFNKEIDGNFNVAIAHRQPGSAMKPIVYATALSKGYTPDTVVFDLPTEFSTECNPDGTPIIPGNEKVCYMPQNYDNQYRGPVSFRDALAQSINVPAIKVLYLAGIKESLRTARDMGIEGLGDANEYGLTLVLGGGEVSPLELTSAYGVFASNGIRNPYTGILRIEDRNGKVIEGFIPSPKQVMDDQTASKITDILSDNKARTPAFGENSPLYFPGRDVAVKTGTTNDYKDAWILGYTPNIAVGAWVGNTDNTPMEKKVAAFIVAPLWNEFMNEALKTLPKEDFKKPEYPDKASIKPVLAGFWQGNNAYFVDKISGGLATEMTPVETKEQRVIRQVHSILYWVDKNNPTGPPPINPESDFQFRLWEHPVRNWALANGMTDQDISIIPASNDNIHTPDSSPQISILHPLSGINYPKNERIVISATAVGKFPIKKADFFINNAFVGSSEKYPFNFTFTPSEIENIDSENELKVVVYDSAYNRGEKTVSFSITP